MSFRVARLPDAFMGTTVDSITLSVAVFSACANAPLSRKKWPEHDYPQKSECHGRRLEKFS